MFQVTPGDDEDLDDIYAAIPAEFKAVRRASQASMGTAEPPPVPTRNPALRKSLKKLMKEHATTVATHQSEEVKKDEVGGFGFGDAGDSPRATMSCKPHGATSEGGRAMPGLLAFKQETDRCSTQVAG